MGKDTLRIGNLTFNKNFRTCLLKHRCPSPQGIGNVEWQLPVRSQNSLL